MKYRNNLTDHTHAAWFVLTAPCTLFIREATCDSGTSTGRLHMLGHVFRQIEARPGDRLADLPGGVFWQHRDGGPKYTAEPVVPTAHPFETGTHRVAVYPVDCLDETAQWHAPTHDNVHRDMDWGRVHATPVGNFIDWIVTTDEPLTAVATNRPIGASS